MLPQFPIKWASKPQKLKGPFRQKKGAKTAKYLGIFFCVSMTAVVVRMNCFACLNILAAGCVLPPPPSSSMNLCTFFSHKFALPHCCCRKAVSLPLLLLPRSYSKQTSLQQQQMMFLVLTTMLLLRQKFFRVGAITFFCVATLCARTESGKIPRWWW